MDLLISLTKFYRNEQRHLPHDPAKLFEMAWQLADILEDEGERSNAWKGVPSHYEFDEFVAALRQDSTVALIDAAVHTMHQTLLDSQCEDTGVLMGYLEGDIVQYLLRRDDATLYEEAEDYHKKLEEYDRRMEELESYE